MSDNVMKKVCQLSFQNELEKATKLNMGSIKYQLLTDEQVDQLAIKIGLLPSEYRNILFFRYCFNNTPSDTDKILAIENTIGKSRYIHKMLSGLMGLKNLWIDNSSMKRACEIALAEDIREYDIVEISNKPKYSRAFRQKLRGIKIKQNFNNTFMLMAKRVAIFVLVCILGFSVVLAANVEAREKVFDWIVEVFEKFSVFTYQKADSNNNLTELTSLKINYVPEGFELTDIHEGRNMLIYSYSTDSNQGFDIKLFTSSDENKSYYDTEGVEIEEIIFKGSQAYMWQTNEIIYLIWHQDGIECHVIGNLSKDEILKVAENISK